ncbi:YgdI/YgdR family lipoprotein [Salmonella enterica subsp. enterica]|nr:YgdI/YgdR family lipoprotein [Salmonella enterica subsp. enterica serovar Mikawasima]EDN7229265.1 YgdI/YgdR family lipoprotein [Salmonella enterica subsp. enterica serovar Mikawasima]
MLKKALFVLLTCAAAVSITACSSDYVMSTKTGELIVTHGKPEIDKGTGMTKYTDASGNDREINTSEVVQMIEKD